MVSCGTSDIIKTVVFIENTAPLLQQIPRKPRIFHEKPQIWNIITLLQNLDINSSFFFSSSAGFLFCCLNFSKYFALFFSSLSASNIPIIIHARSRAYLIIGLSLNFVWSDVFFRTLLISCTLILFCKYIFSNVSGKESGYVSTDTFTETRISMERSMYLDKPPWKEIYLLLFLCKKPPLFQRMVISTIK